MAHLTLYNENPSIMYQPRWVAQGDQLQWLKEMFTQYNGADPSVFFTPELATSIHNQLMHMWPSMDVQCTMQVSLVSVQKKRFANIKI